MPTSPENSKDKSIGDAVITILVPKRAPISSAIIIPAIEGKNPINKTEKAIKTKS